LDVTSFSKPTFKPDFKRWCKRGFKLDFKRCYKPVSTPVTNVEQNGSEGNFKGDFNSEKLEEQDLSLKSRKSPLFAIYSPVPSNLFGIRPCSNSGHLILAMAPL
jgi:hypothetical protein